MANFHTHLVVAAGISGTLAASLLVVGVATPQAVVIYFILGTAGGLLPDIDLGYSVPTRLAFPFLALVCAFMALFHYAHHAHYSILELLIIWGVVYSIVRYGVFSLFFQFTVHRGVIHSIPAALLACFVTTGLATLWLQASPLTAWLAGAFVGLGFLVHLLLDELYSVDFFGLTVKHSFGSALCLGKFGSRRALVATAVLYASTAAAYYYATPNPQAFIKVISSPALYAKLSHRLLPTQGWFKGLGLLPERRIRD